MNQRFVSLLCAAVSLTALSACESGSVKQTLGLSRNSPDEFRVLPRPSLAVPPQFGLRPPGVAGEDNGAIAEMPSSKQAQSLVLGSQQDENTFTLKNDKGAKKTTATKAAPSGKSSAELQFLQNAGATQADPNVRRELVQETIVEQEQVEEQDSWWNVWPSEKKEPIVKPDAETDRIKKNKAENKPVNTGDVPELKSKDRGVLGKVLGD